MLFPTRRTGWYGTDWLHLAQDMGPGKHGNEPLCYIKCDERLYYLRNY